MHVHGSWNNRTPIFLISQTSTGHSIGDGQRLVIRYVFGALRNQFYGVLASVVSIGEADSVHPHRRINIQALSDIKSNFEHLRVRHQAPFVLDKIQLLLQNDVVHQPLGSDSHVRSHVL